MSMPRNIVATWAPTRLLMWVWAQRPNAAEAPVLFIIATSAPRRTRKRRMPTLYGSATEPMKPFWATWTSVPSKEKPE